MQQRVLVPGDVVWIRQHRWLVERSRHHGDVTHIDVLSDLGKATFLSPFDRVVTPPRRTRLREVSAANALRRCAALLRSTTSARAPASALDADVQLWPFQLEPTLAMIHGVRRLLIADAVGLGKTIQAGLAIAEACRRRPSARVLVVVPASLVAQWTDELARRCAIAAIAADASRLDRLSHDAGRGGNVWQRRGVWIASIDFLKQPHVIAALPCEPWDVVVFDEAHALCGDSQRYDAATKIAGRARVLLLLTATPHDGEQGRFDRLLALGAVPHDPQELVAFRRTRADLGWPRTRRVRWLPVTPSTTERDVLDALKQFEGAVMRASAPVSVGPAPDAVVLLLSVFRKRALSSMNALDISLRRRLAWVDRVAENPNPEWRQIDLFDAHSDAISDDDARALTASSGLDGARERLWLCRLIRLTGVALRSESKIVCLQQLLRRTAEPAVVFTEFRHTLEVLDRELRQVREIALLHGGQTVEQQQSSLASFLKGDATVLLATDVASQGLNLQTRARWIICFDLPWNPSRLEQRIGRVDRVGQERTVHATMTIRRHRAESEVLTRITKRVLAADAATHDNTFADWNISEGLIQRAVLCAEPLPKSTASHASQLPVSTQWSRVARATARHLERRRRLTSRGPRLVDAKPYAFVTNSDRLPQIRRLSAGDLGIYSAPLLDRSGDVVEHRLVAIDFGSTRVDRAWLRAHDELVHRLIMDTLSARRRRLSRWMQRRAERLTATERALHADAAPVTPRDVGLFERRDVTLTLARRERELEGDRIADARVDDFAAASVVDLGVPVLELLLVKHQ